MSRNAGAGQNSPTDGPELTRKANLGRIRGADGELEVLELSAREVTSVITQFGGWNSAVNGQL
jgi:hypothetical protein